MEGEVGAQVGSHCAGAVGCHGGRDNGSFVCTWSTSLSSFRNSPFWHIQNSKLSIIFVKCKELESYSTILWIVSRCQSTLGGQCCQLRTAAAAAATAAAPVSSFFGATDMGGTATKIYLPPPTQAQQCLFSRKGKGKGRRGISPPLVGEGNVFL